MTQLHWALRGRRAKESKKEDAIVAYLHPVLLELQKYKLPHSRDMVYRQLWDRIHKYVF